MNCFAAVVTSVRALSEAQPAIRASFNTSAFLSTDPLSLATNFLFAAHSGGHGVIESTSTSGRGRPDRLPSYGQCPHWGSLFCGHLANAVSYQ